MTAKDYLSRAYLLDKQINMEIQQLDSLKSMRTHVQGVCYGERIGSNPNRNLEAPFIRTLEKIWEREQRINEKIDELIDLKEEMDTAIDRLENAEERLLLKYRYLNNESWEEIAMDLNVSCRTVHRIHASAIKNFVVPA